MGNKSNEQPKTVRTSQSTHSKLKAIAKKEDRTIGAVIRRLIDEAYRAAFPNS